MKAVLAALYTILFMIAFTPVLALLYLAALVGYECEAQTTFSLPVSKRRVRMTCMKALNGIALTSSLVTPPPPAPEAVYPPASQLNN